MKFKVLHSTEGTLTTTHRPDVAMKSIVAVACVAVVIWLIANGEAGRLWYVVGLGLLYPIMFAFDKAVTGEANLSTGMLTVRKTGLFGTALFSSSRVVAISDIEHIEMKRHIEMNGVDRFQIRIQLRNGDRVDLSRPTMWFDDCQRGAEEVSRFLGLAVGPRAST